MRKTHNSGRKHKDSVKLYYMNWLEQQAQNMIDQTSKSYYLNCYGLDQGNDVFNSFHARTLGMQGVKVVVGIKG